MNMPVTVMSAALLPLVLLADTIAVGENILNNPELRATEDGLPLDWNCDFEGNKEKVQAGVTELLEKYPLYE